jgi:hypothetical protein
MVLTAVVKRLCEYATTQATLPTSGNEKVPAHQNEVAVNSHANRITYRRRDKFLNQMPEVSVIHQQS